MIQAASILGGRKGFRAEPLSTQDWMFMIRKGFPFKALNSSGVNIKATKAELALILGISVRALSWRRRKGIPASDGLADSLGRIEQGIVA